MPRMAVVPFLLPMDPVASLDEYLAHGGGEGLALANDLGPARTEDEPLPGCRGRGHRRLLRRRPHAHIAVKGSFAAEGAAVTRTVEEMDAGGLLADLTVPVLAGPRGAGWGPTSRPDSAAPRLGGRRRQAARGRRCPTSSRTAW